MKITKRHNDGLVTFATLNRGDTFLFDNEVYLKLPCLGIEDGDLVNAACLNDGCVSGFNAETRVKKVQAELTIEV